MEVPLHQPLPGSREILETRVSQVPMVLLVTLVQLV